jgi:succinyl-CoA synthetase beta subunit
MKCEPFFVGTNVLKAKEVLEASGVPVTIADNLDDAAMKAVRSLSA